MQKLLDKLMIFGLCLPALSFIEPHWFLVAVTLGAVAVSSLCSYFENYIPRILCVLYIAVCVFFPVFTVFLPLVVYDCAGFRQWVLRFCWVAALPFCGFLEGGPRLPAMVLLVSGAAFLLQYRTASGLTIREKFYDMSDEAKEQAAFLERQNRELRDKQDYEVPLATLAERNRIAREIHDNVGHLLTRSLLQLSALRVTYPGGGELGGELGQVKDTLSEAMDSIRSSVHDLHDESVDLGHQLRTMINGFRFCPVKLRYDAGSLPVEMRTCFAAIVREALSNIARHSNATEGQITVTEHPAFCKLTVEDNGTMGAEKRGKGIGLQNMADRVDALGGIFRAEYNKGFRIFISVPKKK